jgi:hypothetical protein
MSLSVNGLVADEDEQRRMMTLKRAVDESGVDMEELGTQRRTNSGRTYTMDVATELPFVNNLYNLTGEDVCLSTIEHPDAQRCTIKSVAGGRLVPQYSQDALLMSLPAAIDLTNEERPAPPGDGEPPAQVTNTWQSVNNVRVYEARHIVGFERPLPTFDRFSTAGVLVTPEVAEALERATLNQRLHHLVRKVETHQTDDEDEVEYQEMDLPRLYVFALDPQRKVLVRYDAQF